MLKRLAFCFIVISALMFPISLTSLENESVQIVYAEETNKVPIPYMPSPQLSGVPAVPMPSPQLKDYEHFPNNDNEMKYGEYILLLEK